MGMKAQKRYLRALLTSMFLAALAGCGHSQINYTPSQHQNMTQHQAASIVEQGFYEDYSQQKPQSAMVTEEFIALSNGSVTRGLTLGTASIHNGVAVGLGSTFLRTEEINQRIYFRSLGTPILSKRNLRDGRYAVTIRLAEGVTARNVYFRSEQRAGEFADALLYLRDASARGELGKQQTHTTQTLPLESDSKELQIQKLMQEKVSYEEYQRRYKAIMAQ